MNPNEVAALLARGRRDEALAAASEGVRANPRDVVWRNTQGAVLVEMERFAEGETALREAIAVGGDIPEALFNLAMALRGQRKFAEQVDTLARIPASWANLQLVLDELRQAGIFLLTSGRPEPAANAFRALLKLQPGARPALHNLVLALFAQQRYEEAATVAAEALAAGHRDAQLLGLLVNARGIACDWEGLDAFVEELRAAARDSGTRPAHPQGAQYLPQVTGAEQRQWAEKYCSVIFAGLAPIQRRSMAVPTTKLRVGYLSSDFRDHAVSWLAVALLENHDRERFEVRAYSTGARVATPVRERIARSIDQFVDCSTVPGHAIAERMAADGIDVLVDLGGHTQGARLDILAYRPAPVQGHFLGYAGTTGAPFVDFFIADEITVPPGAEADFSERVLRMGRSCLPGDPKRLIPKAAPRVKLGLPQDAIVLCSFNQSVKIRRDVFERWCQLLLAIPDAVLWLRDPGESTRRRLVAFAAERGVGDRLVFARHLPTREEHMERLAAADIALDTFPYGSHTNAGDALWAGIPLVTMRGATFASRVGTSLLMTAGLGEWAFDTPEAAFDAVVAMARDPARLEAAKEKVRAARGSAAFDAVGFARDFERLLLQAAGRS